ncbi:MAG: hypothetical protein IPI89_02635 [Propionivibrio sp.]|nr:hypothetical protein [Propionivibrio sp.]
MRDNKLHGTIRASMRGLSLIELMVGMVISLIATLVIFQVFAVSESYKRSTTGGSDALQSGGFAAYTLSRLIGAGGSGFDLTPNVIGCPLGIFRGGAQLFGQATFPYRIGTPLPAPFDAAIDFRIALAPALIIDGGTDPDIIMVMAGSHPSMGRYAPIASQGASTVTLADNMVVGINSSQDASGATQHDLLLAVEQDSGAARGANTSCDIAEAVDSPSITTRRSPSRTRLRSVPAISAVRTCSKAPAPRNITRHHCSSPISDRFRRPPRFPEPARRFSHWASAMTALRPMRCSPST